MDKKGVETGPKSNLIGMILLIAIFLILIGFAISQAKKGNEPGKVTECANNTFMFEKAWCVQNEADCPGIDEGYQLGHDQFGCQKNDEKNICCYKLKET